MLFALADRLVLILEGRELRFRLRKPLPLPLTERSSLCSPTARA
jgi:hypothetical protein